MIAAVVASVGFILMGVGIIVISLFWGCATNSSCTITTAYNEMEYGFALFGVGVIIYGFKGVIASAS